MKLSRTWIDRNLSHKERTALVDWLMERAAQPSGEVILSGLQELFPHLEDYPSVQSCIAWRNKMWGFEVHRRQIREESKTARILADAGDGSSLDEANRVMLQGLIFGQLRALREGRIEDVDAESLAAMARNVSVLARQGMAERELKHKLEQYEAEKKQAAQIAGDQSLTETERGAKMRALFGIGS